MAAAASLRIEAYTPSTITDVQALFDRVREDRAQGFSIVDEELERGLRAIAVPIVDRSGQAVAALNLSTHSTRTTRNEMRERFLPSLRAVAAQISASRGLGRTSRAMIRILPGLFGLAEYRLQNGRIAHDSSIIEQTHESMKRRGGAP